VFEVSLPAAPITNQGHSIGLIMRPARRFDTQLYSNKHDGIFGHLDEITFTVTPGDSQLIYVTYTPTQETTSSGALTIQSSLHDVAVPISGIGAAPHIIIEPSILSFGNVHADSTQTRTITVRDTGDWDLLIASMEFTLGHDFELVPVPQWPDTVEAWNSSIYSVRFAPPDTGIFIDTLRILHDAGDPDNMPLIGRGISYEITLNQDSLYFGEQWLNTTSQDSFLITNSGNVPLEIDSIVCHDDGFHFLQTESFIIEPANSMFVSMSFTPLNTLEYTGTVLIFSNAGVPTITLSGHGIWTELATHPDTIEFWGIGISESADTTVFLESSGNTYISSITASLFIGDAFSITRWPSDSLAAYGNTDMEVSFISNDSGIFKDTLVITHSVGTPIYISLSAEVSDSQYNIAVSIPDDYYLHSNFPNPFNPSTTFRFGVPRTSHVTIKVYDILGRQVETLVNATMPAGHHQIVWNCRNCSSGVYLVVMTGDGFNIVRKATLIR
ncbi:choice-of-anchor D domain-containing protein, partial [bacterium]|nr:choice-of-anchor D domain-containing protein [bacterium]